MSKPTLMIRGKLYSADREEQERLNSWVPYEYILDWFEKRRNLTGITNRVLVLKSETASGKSTLLPPKIFEKFILGKKGPGMICTQPRVMTAIQNVEEMLSHYKFLHRGVNIGWSTQHNKLKPRKEALLSATIGTLTQQLKVMTDEQLMSKYSFILIDETHERDQQTDITIMLLKQFLQRVSSSHDCPFVALMSATFDPLPFMRYFNLGDENFIWCKGEAAGFEKMWNWNEGRVTNNYPQSVYEIVKKIAIEQDEPQDQADILIFLPGKAEFKLVAKELMKLNSELAELGSSKEDKDDGNKVSKVSNVSKCFNLLQVDGGAVKKNNYDNQMLTTPISDQIVTIDGRKYKPYRRVILSTTVAETGLTLSNLKYVIDSGFNRGTEFYPQGITGLITKPAPKSRITQRMGRAGRKFPGVFYPLYPEYVYEMLPDLQFPEILTSDCTNILLDVLIQQIDHSDIKISELMVGSNDNNLNKRDLSFDIRKIDLLDIPAPDSIWYAMEKLYSMGFIEVSSSESNEVSSNEVSSSEVSSSESKDSKNPTQSVFTNLGIIATKIRSPDLNLDSIKLILSGYPWRASILELSTLCAYVASEPRFMTEDKKKPLRWDTIYRDGIKSTREIVNDQFIDGIALFGAIKSKITYLARYCKDINVSFDFVLKFLSIRDKIIEQLLVEGFNVNDTNSLIDSDKTVFMNNLMRIKHCLYETYRLNVLNYRDGAYYTSGGIKVAANTSSVSIEKKAPSRLVYSDLSLKWNMKTNVYDVVPGLLSNIELIAHDANFLL